MLVHRGWGNDAVVALTWVRDFVEKRVYPVHRLDRGTSGVLVFALSTVAASALSEQFAAGKATKRYLALVRGVAPEHGVIDHPIPRREGGPRVSAVTEFRRVAVSGRYSLVEATPRTGRLHQVRRHLKHISHPIIGDVNYGKGEHNRLFREQHGLMRLALHAAMLELLHPTSHQPILLSAPVPRDLAEPLQSAGFRLG
ncbi:MAG: pseudouridylate synthase [Deltaproteobacteria bacterium]|nr:pseudouridylate synthase [Deltaproteobacteria bacterium]